MNSISGVLPFGISAQGTKKQAAQYNHIDENGNAYGISDGTYKVSVLKNKAALVTGTFYRDEEYIFINVRLIRGSDGMVLRTAQTVMPVTPIVGRMTKVKPKPLPPVLPSTSIKVVPGE